MSDSAPPAGPTRRVLVAGLAGTGVVSATGCTVPGSTVPGQGGPTVPLTPLREVPPGGATPSAGVPHPSLRPPPATSFSVMLALPDVDGHEVLRRACRSAVGSGLTVGLARRAVDVAAGSGAVPGLRDMPDFPGDVLERGSTRPDLLVVAEEPDAARARSRVRTWLADQPRLRATWQALGQRDALPEVGGRPMMRNPFGFAEGQSNPLRSDAAAVVTLADTSPWADGAAYLAVRVVRLAQRLWDEEPVAIQERVVGRRQNGRWLDGSNPDAPAPWRADPGGHLTPLDAHVRRANPGTPGDAAVRLLRRSWSYTSPDTGGAGGLLFMAFTRDLDDFETVQRRVSGDALAPYTLTVGGGYFLVPRTDTGWVNELFGR